MTDLPLSALFTLLAALIGLSAFFSGSETAMMALNRYRLRHLTLTGHRGASRASRLLEKPDRLIGVILLGNNFVNILASAIATIIGMRLYGEAGIAVATLALTAVVLIFAEVAPKTVAALYPERIAFRASAILTVLLWGLYPFVWLINQVANGFLGLLGIETRRRREEALTREELRTVVTEAGLMISPRHREMLLAILDLEHVSVEDIMVPRGEIVGLDLEDDMDELMEQILNLQHTELPLYAGDVNEVIGIVHARRLLAPIARGTLDKAELRKVAREPYFVPLGTPLGTQLRNFQRDEQRMGLVVDEYGDIQGLITVEDILEEIVGQFTTDPADLSPDVHPEPDGTYLVDARASVRDLNRTMGWDLPTDGPKTLNGLILEHLETIPEPGTSLLLAGYPVEIVQTTEQGVRTVRIDPRRRRRRGRGRGGTGRRSER